MTFATHLASLEQRLYTALRARADRRLAAQALRAGRRPKPAHLLTGERGEDAAFFHLRRLGYTVVARRWRSERLATDFDLVAWDGPMLVFFEIKTRTTRDLYPAELQVDAHKQRQLQAIAAAYLRQFPRALRQRITARFDVLSVYLTPSGAEFEHLRAAFPISPPR